MIEDFQLSELLAELEEDPNLATEIAACRECWKLLEPKKADADEVTVEVKKRKLSSEDAEEEKRKREEQRLLHEIRSLGDLLENSDFCVDSLFQDPFK